MQKDKGCCALLDIGLEEREAKQERRKSEGCHCMASSNSHAHYKRSRKEKCCSTGADLGCVGGKFVSMNVPSLSDVVPTKLKMAVAPFCSSHWLFDVEGA